MNDNVMYNRLIIGPATVTLRTHAMSHRAKSVAPLTIVELQNFLNRVVVDSPHLGLADRSQDDTDGNGVVGRGNGKRQRNNSGNGNGHKGKKLRPDKPGADPKSSTRGKGKDKGERNVILTSTPS
jgi:hypothetical protein